MAIKINVNTQPYYEFEILDKNYKVYTDDDSIQKYLNMRDELLKQEEDDSIEGMKKLTKESFDVLMGEGAFEEIYAGVGKSSQTMIEILIQVFDHVAEVNNQSATQKFLDAKARKQG
ncbi:hypothetical protein [Bacillus cereus]|uniref:Phage protein n=1 Tax=Bacillus cereus TaxID=1396 RepID=A0A9X7GA26_BACCE|nr:hypothetical protein [Bacillus cereus]PED41967.1 hypothetical protein CON26_20895 [Bacillus cereus]PFV11216.1 hypothetical protein COK98_02800 [Bacillus cereus]